MLTFFQAQVARRAWFVLLAHDFQASFDRGTDPVVSADGYNIDEPKDINDTDFDVTTVGHPACPERPFFGQMTFLKLVAETQQLTRELCFVPVIHGAIIPIAYQR